MVDKGILDYETDPKSGELIVTQGRNYYEAPESFRLLFEGKI